MGKVTRNQRIQYMLGWMVASLKVGKKYSGLLMALIMTIALDSAMTFTMVTVNSGWTAGFIQRFVIAWIIGFAVALPTSLLVFPLSRMLVNRLVSE
jgi:cellulose synthase/poly-beta-1,6-N-acetylglucosamine synthase-like glycosyltransferase